MDQAEKKPMTIEETIKMIQETRASINQNLNKFEQTIQNYDNFKKDFKSVMDNLIVKMGGAFAQQDLHKQVEQYDKAQQVQDIDYLAMEIAQKQHLVFLTGAGISVPSGIKPYRGQGAQEGIEVDGVNYSNEEVARYQFMQEKPEIFWKRYVEFYDTVESTQPNEAHHSIANLQKHIKINTSKQTTLITQNIDNLHVQAYKKIDDNQEKIQQSQMNPSPDIFQIHGNVYYGRCDNKECEKSFKFPIEQVKPNFNFPKCPYCNGQGRPNVLYFDESYDEQNFKIESLYNQLHCGKENQEKEESQQLYQNQCYIVIGTMLETSMANKLVSHCIKNKIMLVEINKYDMVIQAGENSHQLQGSAEIILPQLINSILKYL